MGKRYYIQMFSLHGLIRSDNLELGRDADTGGQVTYALDLARQLSTLEDVGRVDLFTRLIVENCQNGMLVDVSEPHQIADALKTIIADREKWEAYSKNGIMITSVGAEIYYGPHLHASRSWRSHINVKWQPAKIRRVLQKLAYLTDQPEETQRPFKISYYMDPGKDRLAEIHNLLHRSKCKYNLVYSHDQYLDILPYRASKGKAIRFLSYKWEIPLQRIAVSGDSGNDEEMLRGEPASIVVANYSPELNALRKSRRIYFAQKPCAGGIVEGLEKYRFFQKAKRDA